MTGNIQAWPATKALSQMSLLSHSYTTNHASRRAADERHDDDVQVEQPRLRGRRGHRGLLRLGVHEAVTLPLRRWSERRRRRERRPAASAAGRRLRTPAVGAVTDRPPSRSPCPPAGLRGAATRRRGARRRLADGVAQGDRPAVSMTATAAAVPSGMASAMDQNSSSSKAEPCSRAASAPTSAPSSAPSSPAAPKPMRAPAMAPSSASSSVSVTSIFSTTP